MVTEPAQPLYHDVTDDFEFFPVLMFTYYHTYGMHISIAPLPHAQAIISHHTQTVVPALVCTCASLAVVPAALGAHTHGVHPHQLGDAHAAIAPLRHSRWGPWLTIMPCCPAAPALPYVHSGVRTQRATSTGGGLHRGGSSCSSLGCS